MEDFAYILDYLPQGNPSAGFSRREPIVYAVGDEEFKLFELAPKAGVAVNIGERTFIGKDSADNKRTVIDHVKKRIGYDELTGNAQTELGYMIDEIVLANEARFIRFFNEAEAVSLKKHLLEELPGLGKKSMMLILEERQRKGPFAGFGDLTARTAALEKDKAAAMNKEIRNPQGVKNPEKLISARILLEISDPGRKRYIFVTR